jgi:hypothetical protein
VQSALEKGSLANLTDRDLVRRLFQDDRQPASDTLIRCAEAASLVVSYSVVSHDEGATPEYHHLARLADVSPREMHRATREFLNRGVAQQRGPWRAVLPHALAARLARQALASSPRQQIYKTFAQQAQRRLALSFAKRLGQINDHPEAQALAKMLLSADGPIGVVLSHEHGLEMLQALAPAAEEAALDAVERSLDADQAGVLVSEQSVNRFWIAKLVMQLAYDPSRFDRAATLLARIVKDEAKDNNVNNVRNFFEQLFWVVMSGTLAEPDQRMDFVEELLASNDESKRLLGIDALDAALKVSMFSSDADLTKFGGRARSWGWHPQTEEQVEQQFARPARRLTAIAVSGGPLAEQAKSALAHHIRQLSRKRFIHLGEEMTQTVRARRFWAAGWREVCAALHFDGERMDQETRERLVTLERTLAPETLDERFEAFVLQPQWDLYTPYPKHENDHHIETRPEIDRISRELKNSCNQLRGYVVQATEAGQSQATMLGDSLAAIHDADDLFSLAVDTWDSCNSCLRNIRFLLGVLRGTAERDLEKAEEMLDRVADHPGLARELPTLSDVIRPPTARSLKRLLRELKANRIELGSLSWLATGASYRQFPETELVAILAGC